MTKSIFVFASNLAGRHGAGSALEAVKRFGAAKGNGIGRQGNAYAIPTKDGRGGADLKDPAQRLPLDAIQYHVRVFLDYARQRPDYRFDVVAIGCGLSGYNAADIAPMFRGHSPNVHLPEAFRVLL